MSTTDTEALPPLPERAQINKWMQDAGWQNSAIRQADLDKVERIVRAALAQRQQVPEGWQPIETAPKDGSYFMAGNAHGVWVAHYQSVAVSGYKFDNPWRSVMLNHWHIRDKSNQYAPATHWKPLPAAPALTAAPSAQAELRMIECPGCGMEFADGALHNANLELHRLKTAPQSQPLSPTSDSALVAARRTLEGKSGVDFLDGWSEFVAALTAAPQAAEPANRITATEFHDGGAIAQCDNCRRYTLDKNALHHNDSKQPVCDCGMQHYWSGSFKPPGPGAKWFGPAPQAAQAQPDDFERGRQLGMQQERALWNLAKNSQELGEWQAQPQEPPRSAPLTEEQIDALDTFALGWMAPRSHESVRAFARAIEAAHGINAPKEKR